MTELTIEYIEKNVLDKSYFAKVGKIAAFKEYLKTEYGIETVAQFNGAIRGGHKYIKVGNIFYDIIIRD